MSARKKTKHGFICAADAKAAAEDSFVWTKEQNNIIGAQLDSLYDVDATLTALAVALHAAKAASSENGDAWAHGCAVQALADTALDAANDLQDIWSYRTGIWDDEQFVTFGKHVKSLEGVDAILVELKTSLDNAALGKTDRDASRVVSVVSVLVGEIYSNLEPLRRDYLEHVRRFPDGHEPFAAEAVN